MNEREKFAPSPEEITNNLKQKGFVVNLENDGKDVFLVGYITLSPSGQIIMIDKKAIEVNGKIIVIDETTEIRKAA